MGGGGRHTPALDCVPDDAVNCKCCTPHPEVMTKKEKASVGMLGKEGRDERGAGGAGGGGAGGGGRGSCTHLPLTFYHESSTTLCQSPEVGDDFPATSLSASHEEACHRSWASPWRGDKEDRRRRKREGKKK